MEQVITVIDQVLDLLNQGQIEVSNADEVRETLLVLRRLALQRDTGNESFAGHREAAKI